VVIASFQIVEGMGFKGEFRQWEHLLRIGDRSRPPGYLICQRSCTPSMPIVLEPETVR
jgi:hypothetical protein